MAGYGMQSHVMFNFQNSFGTSQVTSLEAVAVTDESVELQISQIDEENMYGRLAKSPSHTGEQSIEGDINMEAEPEGLGFFFRAFTGSDNVSGHVHTFKMNTTDFDERAASTPFTAEIFRDVGSAFLYYDLVASTLELNISNGELMTAGLGVMGAGFSRQTASSPTFPSGETPFKWDQVSASYAGAGMFDLRELTISGNKNLEMIWTLQDTNAPRKIKRTDFENIELSGTILFQSHSYQQAFEAQSENRFFVHFVSNSPNELTLDFPALKFNTFAPAINAKGFIEADFSATAEYSTTSATAMQLTLTNVRTISY